MNSERIMAIILAPLVRPVQVLIRCTLDIPSNNCNNHRKLPPVPFMDNMQTLKVLIITAALLLLLQLGFLFRWGRILNLTGQSATPLWHHCRIVRLI